MIEKDRERIQSVAASQPALLQADSEVQGGYGDFASSQDRRKLLDSSFGDFIEMEECLCPIRIDFELDGIRVRDNFTWNIHESSITPEQFAESLCDDLRLQPKPLFASQIAKIIQEHLDEFYDHRVPVHSDSAESPNRSVNTWELRIIIKLDITIDGVSLVDQVEWDLNSIHNNPERFADNLVTELGLPPEFRTAIAHSVREQTQIYSKSLFLLEHPFDDTPIDDDELAACFLDPINYTVGTETVNNLVREASALDTFSPALLTKREPENEKVEKDKERDARRKRRQTNRNRRALPDRELQRSIRNPVLTKAQVARQMAYNAQNTAMWSSANYTNRRKTRSDAAADMLGFSESLSVVAGTSTPSTSDPQALENEIQPFEVRKLELGTELILPFASN
ncbi:SWI/SNF chromatin-remodeling complex subunit [Phlyctochytrium planicorne]|nr:SWI/SNF chromatin-remodeling complex subunit [Phlyctochytrium planicorne]